MQYRWFLRHWSWYFRHVKLGNYSMRQFALHVTSVESSSVESYYEMLWGIFTVVVFVCRWDNWMQQSMLGCQILCAACGNRWVSLFYSWAVPWVLQNIQIFRFLSISWHGIFIHDLPDLCLWYPFSIYNCHSCTYWFLNRWEVSGLRSSYLWTVQSTGSTKFMFILLIGLIFKLCSFSTLSLSIM